MRWHAEKLISVLEKRYPPEKVHTIVIWTKFPEAIFTPPYRDVLARYDQIYCHITITGLGGTPLEPNVPRADEALASLKELIQFVGSPERVRVRPDPLVFLEYGGRVITNVPVVENIIREAAELGVRTFSTSFMEHYPKVVSRLQKHGFHCREFSTERRRNIITALSRIAAQAGGILYTCAVPGFPVSKCIDGELLARLHPKGEPCRVDKAPGQRKLCGCTHSVDIGWYDMTCCSGCLYCYAQPEEM
jgi:hypothetical protein